MGKARELARVSPNASGQFGIEDLESSATGLLAYRNRIINGSMVVDQRNNGALVSNPGAVGNYVLDRHAVYCTSTNRFSVQRVIDAPTGFVYSQKVTVTNAGTPAAGDENRTYHGIEGLNLLDFAYGTASAQPCVISFRVKSSLTGTFCVSLFNPTGSRAYVTTYNINAANTWESKSVVIPGDTAVAMPTDNSGALYLRFDFGNGSDSETTAGSWVAGNKVRTAGAVRLCQTNGATWQITGLQLERGSVATEFENRSYGTELQLCQRYYEVDGLNSGGAGLAVGFSGYVVNGNTYYSIGQFTVTKRAAPTVTLASPNNPTFNAVSSAHAGINSFFLAGVANATNSAGYYFYTWTASAEL